MNCRWFAFGLTTKLSPKDWEDLLFAPCPSPDFSEFLEKPDA
jgi:hypothetical protein